MSYNYLDINKNFKKNFSFLLNIRLGYLKFNRGCGNTKNIIILIFIKLNLFFY